jgi:hypothetical protein
METYISMDDKIDGLVHEIQRMYMAHSLESEETFKDAYEKAMVFARMLDKDIKDMIPDFYK